MRGEKNAVLWVEDERDEGLGGRCMTEGVGVAVPGSMQGAMQAAPGAGRVAGSSLLLRGVRKAFTDVQAVDGLDLEVARGECFGLLGPNGAGKTTTIEICEGLTAPDEGTVELLGLNWRSGADQLRQRIGIQLQETQFPDKLTVEETLRLFRSFFKHGISMEESISTAQLEEKRRSRVGGLSGGQKQRLAMACALVGDPELLFLDEPTTGLDPQARRHLWDLVDGLKQAGRTIILTTHYMDEAERLCDRVAIMDHGKVISLGTPQQLIGTIGGEDIVEFAVTNSQVSNSQVSDSRPAAPKVEALLAIPGVQSHRVDAGLHQLSVSELHLAVPMIFAAIEAQGLHLSEFRTHSATLEDVFVRLTGRNLRDE
jgi:ABC-2 type transport system ATP-binding protein